MTPPGWRPPPEVGAVYRDLADGASSPRTGPASMSEPSPSPRGVPLATPGLTALGGPLWPGVHLVSGPHGSGKTQLGLQTVVQAALLGKRVRAHLPETGREEAALRVAACLSGVPWGVLASTGEQASGHLDRMVGAPFTLDALDRESPALDSVLSPGLELLLVDPAPAAFELRALRRRALLEHVTVLATCAPTLTAVSSAASPIEHARAYGATDAAVALADSVWVIVPDPMRIGLAKSRRATPGWAEVRFEGARFEDEEAELALRLEPEA